MTTTARRPLALSTYGTPVLAFTLLASLLAECRGQARPDTPRPSDGWPRLHGSRFDATSAETGLTHSFGSDQPVIQWTQQLGPGFGGAAVRNGEVFLLDRILGSKDVLRCFKLESGDEIWRFEYDARGRLNFAGSRGVPTIAADLVYTIGGFGHVHCIDRRTHKDVWGLTYKERFGAERPRYGWAQSPLVVGKLVVVAPMSKDAGLVALNRFTGAEVWRTAGLGCSHSSPVLMELDGHLQILYMSSYADLHVDDVGDPFEGFVSAFDPKDGSLLWRFLGYKCLLPIPSPILVDKTHVFLTGGYGAGSMMLEVKAKTNGEEFSISSSFTSPGGAQIHQPILVGTHLYTLVNGRANEARTARKEGGLQCLDLEGNELWRTGNQPYFGRGSMILADGMLIIQDGFNGVLRLVDPSPDGFRLLGEAAIFPEVTQRDGRMWAPMAISEGRLLLRSQETLKCVDMRAKK